MDNNGLEKLYLSGCISYKAYRGRTQVNVKLLAVC